MYSLSRQFGMFKTIYSSVPIVSRLCATSSATVKVSALSRQFANLRAAAYSTQVEISVPGVQFDTMRLRTKLRDSGFTEKQSEDLVISIHQILNDT
jgi:hypothetical protein